MFLQSEYVNLYPSALRGGTSSSETQYIKDPESKIGTEYNITSAINNLSIDGSFVLDKQLNAIDNDHKYLRFCVHGYTFRINAVPLLSNNEFTSATEIYANIKLTPLGTNSTNTDAPYKLLTLDAYNGTSKILDDNSSGVWEFKGIDFSTTKTTSTNCYGLLIFERNSVNDEWSVPVNSYLRFDADAIEIAEPNGAATPTPLSHILYENNSGNIVLDVDEASFNNIEVSDLAIIDKIQANEIKTKDGSKTSINSNGVAQRAFTITDNSGNPAPAGSNIHPVYVNADGKIVATNNKIENSISGNADTATEAEHAILATSANKLVNSSNVDYSVGDANTAVYFNNGIPVAGMKIHVSQNAPTASDPGKDGDIWFQYS